MSANRRKNTPSKIVNGAEESAAARVIAVPKGAEIAKPRLERIGDVLREARLEKNDDLYLIAEYLRIKPAFLIALENSQYDEFPADAYVIGFLRTYANFLGVDGKNAVDRYRYEMAGRRKKPVLSMPIPVSGGRTPSVLIMVGATIAGLLIYALWYGIASGNRAEVNMQPPALAVASDTAAQPTTAVSPTEANVAAGLTAPVGASAPVASPAPASAAAVVPAPVAAVPAVSPQMPEPASIVVSAKPPVPVAKETKKQAAADGAAGARLVIRATQSSWVMITDDSGKAIYDHVMKAGDIYKVPNKPGLSLTTGNGAGIVLSLDGTDLPKLGNGAPRVVRNVALDPDTLSSNLSTTDR